MSQAIVLVAMHVLGLMFGIAVGPRDRVHLCGAFGFLIGLTLWVTGYFLVLLVGAPPLAAQVGTYLFLLTGFLALAIGRGRLGRDLLAPCLAWTAGFLAVALSLTMFNLSHFTPDSMRFLIGAGVVGEHGLVPLSWGVLSTRGLFHPLAHSTAALAGVEYLYSYHLTIGVSFAAAFIFLGVSGLRRLEVPPCTAIAVLALTTAAMATTNMVLWHASYIHGNLSSGIYLWAFAGLFWYAQLEERPEVLPLAVVALAGLGFQRLETGVVAALFLALALAENRLAIRTVFRWSAAAVASVAMWLVIVAWFSSSRFVSPGKSAAIITLLVVPLALWRSGRLSTLFPRLPQLALAGIVLFLAGAVATAPENMLKAAQSTATNLFEIDRFMWGITPFVLIAIGALLAAAPRVPYDRLFSYGSLIYVLFVLAIVRLRGTYRVGWGDSGNRMLVHVIPLAFFFVALRLGPLSEPRRAPLRDP